MISPSLLYPVCKQVIFEPEGIGTCLVIGNKIHFPHQGPMQPGSASVSFPATLLSLRSLWSLVPATHRGHSLLRNWEQGAALARKALPAFTVCCDGSS